MKLDPKIKAVCFDAFGTLVEIKDKRRPYVALLRLVDGTARSQLKKAIMREPLSLDDCVTKYALKLGAEDAAKLKEDLAAELASITLRPHINELWAALRAGGYKIALCSNLGLSYGPPLLKKLPGDPDALILSYETGHIKPDPEIYQLVCDKLSLPAEAILFTGDTKSADVEGPIAFGMQAIHIDELTASIF